MPKIQNVIPSIYFRDFIVTEPHSLSERVAVTENDIEHIQADINNIGDIMRTTAERHDEKFEQVLSIALELKNELTRYKIVSGTAVMILGGLLAGANYLMGVFGVSIADIWSKK